MNLKSFYFNPYRECTYLLYNEQGEVIIIDAGMSNEQEQQRFAQFLTKEGLHPVALLITHSHPDHICGMEWLCQTYALTPTLFPSEGAIAIDGFPSIEVLRTPGHKEDCVCYYMPSEKWLFTGDTLFCESVGRTDLPGGNYEQLMQSLQRLMLFPDDTQILPGHGYTSTLAHERRYNPFLSL